VLSLAALFVACTASSVITLQDDAGGGDARPDGIEDIPDPPDTDVGDDTGSGEAPFAHLPVFLVDAAGGIGDTEKTDATLEVIEDHDGTLADLDTAPRAYVGPIGIEIHGSSSTGYPKLAYKFECRDDAGDDTNCALVHLPAGSDWVLHAPYSDKTYMRNALAYGLGRAAAADRGAWEPRTQFVELVLDGEYEGVYVLVERVSREDDRLAIPKTTDPVDGTVAGGFIVKVDQHRSAGFDTARGTPIDWAEPKSGEVTPAEAAYMLDWFDRAEAVLAGDGFADPATGYAAVIDVDAWVDHWLLNELAHNIDAYRLSAYLWTDGPPGTALLRAGPLWDFDRAFGDVNYCYTWTTDGWIYDSLDECGYAYEFPFWWERLRQDPAFRARLRTRWDELRAGALSDDAITARIAGYRAETAEAEVRDHQRWPIIGTSVDPNYYVGATWNDEIVWLREWTLERAAWMDLHVGE
jgi:hypothetical protein